MTRILQSFKIRSKNKILDYRLSENIDLVKVKNFFQQNYLIQDIWKGPRHILGILLKDKQKYFLKLATSEGISVVTKNEYYWNDYFNANYLSSDFCVPKNFDSGFFDKKNFYIISEYFDGELLGSIADISNKGCLEQHIPQIITLSEVIQKLPEIDFTESGYQEEKDYKKRFLNKTIKWFEDIPPDIVVQYSISSLLKIVENGVGKLSSKPRHGDFTPWHIFKKNDGKLGLIDGEHALADSVENYDICYFIQRVFSVSKNPDVAKSIYSELMKRGYDKSKLKIVLAARAIGGFLDESLSEIPDYYLALSFKDWVLSI